MANQYRYAKASFERSVVTAMGLTAIVSFLVWLGARLLAAAHPNWITGISALVFFAFCSAMMIWRYMRNDIVLAIRPDGLYYARHSSQAVPWEEIKDINVGRREDEFELEVTLWPRSGQPIGQQPNGTRGPRVFSIDLAPLDAGAQQVVDALLPYARVSMRDP